MLPTFLGVGVAKAGTTWLHELLKTHPEVFVPKHRKEILYFDVNWDRGIDWYERHFPSDKDASQYKAIGEITPQYWIHDVTAERIGSVESVKKIIIMLRDPIKRVYSHYHWAKQIGTCDGTLEEFLTPESHKVQDGLYAKKLKIFYKYFNPDQVLVMIFEHVFDDVEGAKKRIADFLEIDYAKFDSTAGYKRVNVGKKSRFPKFYNWVRKTGFKLRGKGFNRLVEMVKGGGIEKIFESTRDEALPPMDEKTRKRLQELYAPEISELESMLNIDLSCWKEQAK